jgi:hypothetical protein
MQSRTISRARAIPHFTLTTHSCLLFRYQPLSYVAKWVQANWGLDNLGRQDTNKSVSNVFDFVARAVNYSNVVISDYPLNNVSEGGAFNNHSSLWGPIPSPNISAQGAGGPILPLLASPVETTTQSSHATGDGLRGPILFAFIVALGGGWYLNR